MFEKILRSINPVKAALISGSVVFSCVLIMLNNSGLLPLSLGDFFFFSGIVFLAALYRPGWVFLFFVGLLPFVIVNMAPKEIGMMLRPYQWVGILALAAVMVRFFSGRLPFSFPKVRRLDWLLLLFWVGSLVAVTGAPNRSVSVKQSIVLFSFLALYALTRIFIRTVGDAKNVLPVVVGSGAVVSLYAIWQNVRFSEGANAFEVMAGRPNSVFTEPDWLGVFLAVCIAVVYAALFMYRKPRSEFMKRHGVLFILHGFLIGFFVALILSVARSAWLSTIVMTVLACGFVLVDGSLLAFNRWKWREAIIYAAGIAVSFAISLSLVFALHLTTFQLFNRAQSTASGLQKITIACEREVSLPEKIGSVDELLQYDCRHIMLEEKQMVVESGAVVTEIYRNDPNVDIRKGIYEKTAKVIREHILFGVGFGSSSSFLGQDERGAGLNSSNIFLEVWLGSGLIGLLAFLYVWLFIGFRAAKHALMQGSKDDVSATYIFIFLSWIGLTVFNLFNAGIFLGFLWVWLAVAVSFAQKNNYLK